MTMAVRPRRKVNRHALHALRVRAGLTQESLALQAGIAATSISHLERGARLSCPVEVAEKMAVALGVPPGAIYAAE